jgi:hypothetical protein
MKRKPNGAHLQWRRVPALRLIVGLKASQTVDACALPLNAWLGVGKLILSMKAIAA